MRLPENYEKILEVLVDECNRNSQVSLSGLNMKLLGEKVGAYRGISVKYDVDNLRHLGYVIENGNNVILTQKGRDYIKTKSRQKYYWIIALLMIVGIALSIYSQNLLYFVSSVISSIIAGLVVYMLTKPQRDSI